MYFVSLSTILHLFQSFQVDGWPERIVGILCLTQFFEAFFQFVMLSALRSAYLGFYRFAMVLSRLLYSDFWFVYIGLILVTQRLAPTVLFHFGRNETHSVGSKTVRMSLLNRDILAVTIRVEGLPRPIKSQVAYPVLKPSDAGSCLVLPELEEACICCIEFGMKQDLDEPLEVGLCHVPVFRYSCSKHRTSSR